MKERFGCIGTKLNWQYFATRDYRSRRFAAGSATNWTSVSSGANHTCGRRATGRLYCWGDDSYGRLGNGGADVERDTPVEIAA